MILDEDTHLVYYPIVSGLDVSRKVRVFDQFRTGDVFLESPEGFTEYLVVPSDKDAPVPSKLGTWGKLKTIYR